MKLKMSRFDVFLSSIPVLPQTVAWKPDALAEVDSVPSRPGMVVETLGPRPSHRESPALTGREEKVQQEW